MSLVFAGIVPEVAGLNDGKRPLGAELLAMEGELYQMKPDTLVVLSSVGATRNVDSILLADTYIVGEREYSSDTPLSTRIKKSVDRANDGLGFEIVAQNVLSKELTAALEYTATHLVGVRLSPILTGVTERDEVHILMRLLRDIIEETNARVAVLATGVLASESASEASSVELISGLLRDGRLSDLLDPPKGAVGSLIEPMRHLAALLHDHVVGVDVFSGEAYDGHTAIVSYFPVQ